MPRSRGDQPPVAYLDSGAWPGGQLIPGAPPSASAAQQLARALQVAMSETGTGQRALAAATGVAHTTIGRILAGAVLCDIGTLANLENALGRPLWPRLATGKRRPEIRDDV
ncbi:helix-turn-helix domain-containing protein [[Mycobacterium] zoologicum]|uniref:helix-turn-helix domain-containing protein n=1 Tax=[Mycobacterium] zoologicum TaxID=2872311 RepID=UPI001CDAFCA2|nr:helix-turn-helix transcriptional regulator [Mycolicibacter sp. MYC101]MEB3064374.1 helix-turn-helix transcriptional regulator [Mycolicibacter sp. MYC101]